MSEREDRAKTLVQSSRATVDTLGQVLDETFNESYPIVQGVYKLMRYTVLIHEAARAAITVDDEAQLAQVEKQARQYLATARTLQNRVMARLAGPAKAEFGKVRDGFANLETLLLSNAGLLALHRKGLAARVELRSSRQLLATAQNTYSEELQNIEASAEQFNENARRATMVSVAAANKTVGLIVAAALVLAIVFGMTFARRLVGPLNRLTADMRRLARGDLDGEPAVYHAQDEIAEMLAALEVFRETARRDQAFAVARDEDQHQKEERQAATERHIREFDDAVMKSLITFSQAASDMRATAEIVAKTADETSRQAATVSVAARDTSQNVGMVATAAGQLLLSTSEISRQITHSASIAEKALEESERAHTIVKGFADAAGKIGSIVSVIQNVAQSTNLLALNATIEAARAGAAGRGFGVVATEVKALATQTAAATSEIESQINGIQDAAQDVVAAIDEIGSTIREMNNASEVIGTAAGQQSATTQDIARAVQETARRTVQVTTSIGQVDHGAGLTGSAAAQVLNTANELGARSLELRTHIEKFFSGLRAA
jgi:methyl-accepting chemotaxis protein